MSTDPLAVECGSRSIVTTVLDNYLILAFFKLQLVLISVPDDEFKLEAEICRTYYTL
jgi:hypothetical protein